jgi:heterotetrameric sarcosine oxidase gamma subunit
MIPQESVTVTTFAEDRLTIEVQPPERLLAIEVWGDRAAVDARFGAPLPLPGQSTDLGGLRILWWEPGIWIVRMDSGSQRDLELALADALSGEGAMSDLSGGFVRIRLSGRLWRELLMIGGVFDAESQDFGPGSVAGTVIHHMPVRLDVISQGTADAYVPPSYAENLIDHWTRSQARLLSAPGS